MRILPMVASLYPKGVPVRRFLEGELADWTNPPSTENTEESRKEERDKEWKTGGSFPPSGLGRGMVSSRTPGPDGLDACFSFASAGPGRWGIFSLSSQRVRLPTRRRREFRLAARGKSRHGIRPSLHPGGLRCYRLTYSRYAPSEAPGPAGAGPVSVLAGLSPRTARRNFTAPQAIVNH